MSFPDSSKPLSTPRPPLPTANANVAPALGINHDTAPTRLPAILSAGPTVAGLANALVRRWASALTTGTLLAGLAAAGLWFAFPSKYTAEQSINLNRPPREVFQGYEQMVEPLDFMR